MAQKVPEEGWTMQDGAPWPGNNVRDQMSRRMIQINMKGLDGIQGPIYVGTGCVFRRQALYGFDAPVKEKRPARDFATVGQNGAACAVELEGKTERKSEAKRRRERSQSSERHLLKCMHLRELMKVGWIYGSVTEDILTGFKMHLPRLAVCLLHTKEDQRLKDLLQSTSLTRLHPSFTLGPWICWEIFLSKHCPIWYGYGGGLEVAGKVFLHKFSRLSIDIHSIDACTALCPAICLLTGKFIIPEVLWFFEGLCNLQGDFG
ncbi:hypothetical protein J5N97_022446 [Dioscorea zingiberensis]|uniref:Cellulose synthase n=1 Tax=Dioscorea zingiberensis TaxID=325984 RepID=A0A9D5CAT5_9LILI|nr:hypothetical protein J5N97_022446 [Dioscorea zingiberensis]